MFGIWLCKRCYAQSPMSAGKPAEPCPTCDGRVYLGIEQIQAGVECFSIRELEFQVYIGPEYRTLVPTP